MQAALPDHLPMRVVLSQIPLANGIVWGFIGGLVATLVMDLSLMSALLVASMPALTCFSIVGDTVARSLSLNGLAITGSIPLGIAAHYLIGPLMGIMFGALVKVNVLRVDSLKKVVILAVLYAEILSQPMLAIAPILLRMTASATLQWYGGSLIMHMIWGCVLGVVWSKGLRLPLTSHSN
jgi:hypothetical protein